MSIQLKRTPVFLIGLWVLIWIGYSSSLTASWHLDDFQNIVRNERIHMSQIDAASLMQTFFAGTSDKLYRPVPMASFAFNWYHSGADVLGYHIVNVVIHCLNACLLYLVVQNLLQSPRLQGRYDDSQIRWMAFLAALCWSLNPVQTQAVTYIVQRMASMAALFYMIGIYLFLKYKHAASVKSKRILLVAIAAAYLLAIFSKENAALFPAGIFLIQFIFYPSDEPRPAGWKTWLAAGLLVLIVAFVGVLIVLIEYGNPLAFIDMLYANRPFTAPQRLMTEPRILLAYLSLLLFPAPWRLSLSHDIPVSTALFEPWTTFPALFTVVALVGWCLFYLRKMPLITFAGLFFFVNHLVESTILPLELMFEHRNYLPSMFLFLPLAHGVVQLNEHRFLSKKYGRYLIVGGTCIAIGLLCNWTFGRNLVWQSEKTLWEDEISKNPRLARPYHNLAWGYYQARGRYDEALALYQKALTLKSHSTFETASTLNNLGRILYLKGDYEQALHYFEKSVNAHPQRSIAEYQIVMTLIQLDRLQEAQISIDSALNIHPTEPFFIKLKGILLARMGKDDEALSYLQLSVKQNAQAVDSRAHLSLVLSRMGRIDEAVGVLVGAHNVEKGDPLVLMALCEIEKHKGNLSRSDDYLYQLIENQGIDKVREMLLSWRKDKLSINIDYDHYLLKLAAVQTE